MSIAAVAQWLNGVYVPRSARPAGPLRDAERGLRPVVRLVDEAREVRAGDDEHGAIRIDGGSARSPDAAGASMRSRNGRECARHLRRECVDGDEQARRGVAEGHIQPRTVGTEIQRTAL